MHRELALPEVSFYIAGGASADGVGPKRATCGATLGKPEGWFYSYNRPSGRGLRRDTRDYYQGVGTPGGLAGLVLPLSKCLVHRDSEPDRISLR